MNKVLTSDASFNHLNRKIFSYIRLVYADNIITANRESCRNSIRLKSNVIQIECSRNVTTSLFDMIYNPLSN